MLSNSREGALMRLHKLERKIVLSNKHTRNLCKNIICKITWNHSLMTLSAFNLSYLPHAVVKESSTTTIKSSTRLSRNDLLLAGPTIQQGLFSIIPRFRTHRVAMMYQQILINPSKTDLQTTLRRDDLNSEIQIYKLETVSYGTVSAPFLTISTLHVLATDEHDFQKAAMILRGNF
ncbi:hypothetical protein PR048_010524 [Dryococelus australis]|uniref:Uncharacterized protein n=1 Tax=Dryococelus australis TaxID=614101 RepID=A0ABQ9I2X7_9NEOP|nr:hypothetical protein PR048_010524 [Dryococelus australis]